MSERSYQEGGRRLPERSVCELHLGVCLSLTGVTGIALSVEIGCWEA